MTWVYIIPLFFLIDVMLYIQYWRSFAKRYYFVNYGVAVGCMMAYTLRKKDG